MLTQAFLAKIRNSGLPMHKLAWEAGITPNQLYKITSGVDRPGAEDPRIVKLCTYLQMPIQDAFEGHTMGA